MQTSSDPRRELGFLDGLRLAQGRAHEATGPARHTLALWLAGATAGPVFWVAPGWGAARPYGPGMVEWADPGRFVFIRADRPLDVLWTLEEVMRAGQVPLVVGDLPAAPGLTPVRRLHLAGERGGREGRLAPLALLLTPEGAAPGVESRWRLAPAHGPEPDRQAWRLDRLRGRAGPPQSWQIRRLPAGLTRSPLPGQPARPAKAALPDIDRAP